MTKEEFVKKAHEVAKEFLNEFHGIVGGGWSRDTHYGTLTKKIVGSFWPMIEEKEGMEKPLIETREEALTTKSIIRSAREIKSIIPRRGRGKS